MIKLIYPKDIEKLKEEYLKLFDLDAMESEYPFDCSHSKLKLKNLLIGPFESLVDIFLWYKKQNFTEEQTELFKAIFDYEAMQPKIASFFMDSNNGFDLSTCHYCNMAYINSYSKSLSYSSLLDFINYASIAEWREYFNEDRLPDDKLNQIIKKRPFDDVESFNRKKYLWKKIELYKGFTLDKPSNHFDLDHLLPKSVCPLIGLSLFNFVPSCQVCNEKLKKAKELATSKEDWLKISPTHQKSKFDSDVAIKLIPSKTCSTFFELQQNNEHYKLLFDTQGDLAYDNYISIFKLNDRYNYHKKLALHILDLKERYPEEKRKEISRLLSAGEGEKSKYSEEQIKEDIFNEGLYKNRCFSKLRNDMIHKN